MRKKSTRQQQRRSNREPSGKQQQKNTEQERRVSEGERELERPGQRERERQKEWRTQRSAEPKALEEPRGFHHKSTQHNLVKIVMRPFSSFDVIVEMFPNESQWEQWIKWVPFKVKCCYFSPAFTTQQGNGKSQRKVCCCACIRTQAVHIHTHTARAKHPFWILFVTEIMRRFSVKNGPFRRRRRRLRLCAGDRMSTGGLRAAHRE